MLWLNKVGFKGRVKASPSGRLFIANCYPTVAKWPHTVDLAKMYTRNKKACWQRSERWERKKHHRLRITDSSIFVRLIASICRTWHSVLVHRWIMQGQFFYYHENKESDADACLKTITKNGFKCFFMIWISHFIFFHLNFFIHVLAIGHVTRLEELSKTDSAHVLPQKSKAGQLSLSLLYYLMTQLNSQCTCKPGRKNIWAHKKHPLFCISEQI